VSEPYRALCFTAGVSVAGVALASPLAEYTDTGLTAHMTQHVLLLSVVGPLFALSAPRRLALDGATAPIALVAALAFQSAVMVLWHVPAFYDTAVASTPVHVSEHLSFLAAGTLFWWVVISVPRARYGFSVLALFVAALPCTAVGAGLALSSRPWYSAYPSISDQQTAGVVMWVVPGLVFVVAAAILVVTWIAEAES
jgi:cytochrome c oxidase assembly factor CtaG